MLALGARMKLDGDVVPCALAPALRRAARFARPARLLLVVMAAPVGRRPPRLPPPSR